MKVGRGGLENVEPFQGRTGGIRHLPRTEALKKIIKKKTGVWTVDELVETMPKTLLKGYKSKSGSAD